jgi:enamine deaminase RidA (YjgF/YER057c/UK114 family)
VPKEIFEAFDGQQELLGFSQAVRVGDTVYVSGTVGIGEGMHIPDALAEQMTVAYRNIAETLDHFGATMTNVVEQTVYVTDMAAAAAAADVRKAAFPAGQLPASTMVEVRALFMEQLKVEIAVTARLDI